MLFAIDWSGGGERVALGEGVIGAVETRDNGFTAEPARASGAARTARRGGNVPRMPGRSATKDAGGDGGAAATVAGGGGRRAHVDDRCRQPANGDGAGSGAGSAEQRRPESAIAASNGTMVITRAPPVLPVVAGDLLNHRGMRQADRDALRGALANAPISR